MRTNTAKRRMLAGEPAIGVTLALGSPLAGEMLSHSGFDYVMVDAQHGPWDDANALAAFHSICLGPAVPMARVQQNDFYVIGRLLDRGALGIIVPMVNSAAEARAAAQAVRYPPRGSRSWAPYLTGYGVAGYDTWINDEVLLAVQIETAEAAAHVEEIMAVEGVDACWIGPVDLAKTMGVDVNTPEGAQAHEAAILRVLAACRKTHKIPGISADAEYRRWLAHGFLFVTVASDAGLMLGGARELLRTVGRA
jgi:4-hydroxy-2-oxoheptanedioate aldolase